MSDKKHVTIDFTIEMLDKLNPCPAGREAALAFLPAKLSTDPEENIDLACALACSERAAAGQSDARWLMSKVAGDTSIICCSGCDRDYYYNALHERSGGDPHEDPLLIAQYLAWIADKLATDAGR